MAGGRKKARGKTIDAPIAELIDEELVPVPSDMSLVDLRRTFWDRGLNRVVVIDSRRRPLGVIAKADLLVRIEVGGAGRATDMITPGAVTLPSTMSLRDASALMVRRKLEGVVVTFNGRFAWVTAADVVRWVAGLDSDD